MNVEADAYSKILDFDDWAVSPLVFQYFNNVWGPFHIDRFADNRNKHVEIFNSQFWCPGTSGVDAFAFDWSGKNNWLVPPVHLVNKVIQHMIKCGAEGTLVVPKWKSSMFWPAIVNTFTGSYREFVVDFVEYEKPKSFFVPGSCFNSVFAVSPFNGSVLVLKIKL